MSNKNKYQPLPPARIIMVLGPFADNSPKDFDEFKWVVRKAAQLAEDVERIGDR